MRLFENRAPVLWWGSRSIWYASAFPTEWTRCPNSEKHQDLTAE